MVDNPIKIHKDIKQIQSWRVDDKSKIIHKERFITHGFATEKDRIREAIEKNKFLQTEPIQQIASLHNFRPLERREHNKSASISKELMKATMTSLGESKASLPDINQKTHFKAVVSLAMQVGCLKKSNNVKVKDMDYEDAISRVKEANNLYSPNPRKFNSISHNKLKIESDQRPEKLAEYILVACNVINDKVKKSKQIISSLKLSENHNNTQIPQIAISPFATMQEKSKEEIENEEMSDPPVEEQA